MDKEVDIVAKLHHDLHVSDVGLEIVNFFVRLNPDLSGKMEANEQQNGENVEVKSEEMLRSLWQMKVLPLLTCLHIHAHVYFTPFQPEQLQFVIFLLFSLLSSV